MRAWWLVVALLGAACDGDDRPAGDATVVDALAFADARAPDAGVADATIDDPCNGPEDCPVTEVCCMIQTASCSSVAQCRGVELCHTADDCRGEICCPQGFCGPGCD